MRTPRWRHAVVLLTVATAVSLTSTAALAASRSINGIHKGGALNVIVVGAQWPGLDVGTNTQDAADSRYQDQIYGDLFQLGAKGKIIFDQATGYRFSNHNETVTISIRKGLKFSNGDPLTAENVAWSMNRDLEPQYSNIGDVNFPLASPATTGPKNTMVLHLKFADVAIIAAFINEAPNWVVDENALNTMGEQSYAQKPIGAGPFTVTSNTASALLVLNKNPLYWQKGHPYLSQLTFTTIGNDQSAICALQSGQDQVALGLTTIPLIKAVKSQGLNVTNLPATATEFINLNTLIPPFNNILAREAVSYATNAKSLVTNLYSNAYTAVTHQTAPGQLFYTKSNKYYLPYNLNKAKALVQQLGGLTVSLSTTSNTLYWYNEVQAIATMWQAAGIKVNIEDFSLQQMLGILLPGTFQAIDENWGGSVDPGIDLPQFFRSRSSGTDFSGVNDSVLDGLFNQSLGIANPTTRAKTFEKIANLENQKVYAVWLYAKNAFLITTKNVVANAGFSSQQVNQYFEDISLK